MQRPGGTPFASIAFLWPALVAEQASEFAAALAREYAELAIGPEPAKHAGEPNWTTRNRVALELTAVRLRDFSRASDGVPVLVCAPFALHRSTIVDLAPRHSLVAALLGAGLTRVFATDWRSASPDMRFMSIDNYLAELNVLVDQLAGTVDLIGLCQGGWMALTYAALFPAKVRRLVLAGAPIDIAAGHSTLSDLARETPIALFRQLVDLGGGRVLGDHALRLWSPSALAPEDVADALQSSVPAQSPAFRRLESRFRDWHVSTLDLPGTYYLQVVEQLFKENRLAAGRFIALGRKIELANVRCPLFLLAARDDEVTAPEQTLAAEHLVGSAVVCKNTVPCGHLGLFMGENVLANIWPAIAHWLLH